MALIGIKELIITAVVTFAIAFVAGYSTCAYRNGIKAAKTEAVQATGQAVAVGSTKATDAQGITRLQAQLSAEKARSGALETMINEARNAQAPTPVDCRLPDGVRAAINADLAAHP